MGLEVGAWYDEALILDAIVIHLSRKLGFVFGRCARTGSIKILIFKASGS